jgi:cation diffusion facilitator CzcD-associated flavoprotein CzcO
MAEDSLHVLVIGGGLAGLALAHGLTKVRNPQFIDPHKIISHTKLRN